MMAGSNYTSAKPRDATAYDDAPGSPAAARHLFTYPPEFMPSFHPLPRRCGLRSLALCVAGEAHGAYPDGDAVERLLCDGRAV